MALRPSRGAPHEFTRTAGAPKDQRQGVPVMTRKRASVLVGVAVIAAAGLGAAVAIAATGGSDTGHRTAATAPGSPPYSYYHSMMGSYLGDTSMMGGSGSNQWMMGPAGYRWMFGGTSAPAW